MPTFRICQYEISTQEYRVKADTPADAIVATGRKGRLS